MTSVSQGLIRTDELLNKTLFFNNVSCKHALILGTNFITKTGIKLDYDTGQMKWYDSTLPMYLYKGLTSTDFDNREDMYHIQFKDELLCLNWLKLYINECQISIH
jgi:hypothetical protein